MFQEENNVFANNSILDIHIKWRHFEFVSSHYKRLSYKGRGGHPNATLFRKSRVLLRSIVFEEDKKLFM